MLIVVALDRQTRLVKDLRRNWKIY